MFVQHRKHGLGMGRAPGEEHGRHIPALDQLARVFGSDLGVELVVQRDQFDFLAVHATACVDAVDPQARTIGGLLHARRDGAGEAGRLADQDL